MRERGTVVSWDPSRGGFGFVRADADGANVFVGGTILAQTGIKRLAAGDRILFDRRADRFDHRGDPHAINVRVIFT